MPRTARPSEMPTVSVPSAKSLERAHSLLEVLWEKKVIPASKMESAYFAIAGFFEQESTSPKLEPPTPSVPNGQSKPVPNPAKG